MPRRGSLEKVDGRRGDGGDQGPLPSAVHASVRIDFPAFDGGDLGRWARLVRRSSSGRSLWSCRTASTCAAARSRSRCSRAPLMGRLAGSLSSRPGRTTRTRCSREMRVRIPFADTFGAFAGRTPSPSSSVAAFTSSPCGSSRAQAKSGLRVHPRCPELPDRGDAAGGV